MRRDEVVPQSVARLVQTSFTEDSCVVDDEVEPAELLLATGDRGDHVLLVPHVALGEDGPTFGAIRLFGRLASRFGVACQTDHARALAAEGEQDLPAEPAGGSGDDSLLVGAAHLGSSKARAPRASTAEPLLR